MKEQDDFESYLIMTDSAKLTLEHETKMKIEEIEQLADHVIDSREDWSRPSQWIIQNRRNAHCSMQYEDDRRNSQWICRQSGIKGSRCNDQGV